MAKRSQLISQELPLSISVSILNLLKALHKSNDNEYITYI